MPTPTPLEDESDFGVFARHLAVHVAAGDLDFVLTRAAYVPYTCTPQTVADQPETGCRAPGEVVEALPFGTDSGGFLAGTAFLEEWFGRLKSRALASESDQFGTGELRVASYTLDDVNLYYATLLTLIYPAEGLDRPHRRAVSFEWEFSSGQWRVVLAVERVLPDTVAAEMEAPQNSDTSHYVEDR